MPPRQGCPRLIVTESGTVQAQPPWSAAQTTGLLGLEGGARQQTGFLSWATKQLDKDWSSDPLYLEALEIEIEIAEKKQTHYQSLFEFSKCHSDSRWNERLIPDPI